MGTEVSWPATRSVGPVATTANTAPTTVAIRTVRLRRQVRMTISTTSRTSGAPNQVFCSVIPTVFSAPGLPARVSRAKVRYEVTSSPQSVNRLWMPR
jgi:hypothetical protein